MNQPGRKPVYHFVSHTHWDREWYRPFESFRLDLVDMINSLLEIFRTVPEYRYFTLDGQTIILEDFTAIQPEKMSELRHLIQSGKVLVGPWYVLADEFLVSGESTLRNLLIGRKVAGRFGGEVMPVGYLPDSFGHIAMMPAILRGFGIDSAVVYRGFGGEPGQEKSEYRWQSPDGSEVLMIHLPPGGYGDAYLGSENREKIIAKGEALQSLLDPRATTPHRLCMNGGDHHFPEPNLPEALAIMNQYCQGKFVHSNLPAYVQAVHEFLTENPAPLQKVAGELRGGYRYAFVVNSGIYSSRLYLKQANDRCEKILVRYAEPLAVWATIAGREHLFAMLERAWKLLLQNHAHDSICGCSIDEVHREMEIRFHKVEQIAEAVVDKSLKFLFPEPSSGELGILIFNPAARTTDHPVLVELEFFRGEVRVGLNPHVRPEPLKPPVNGFRILDEKSKEVPFQILDRRPKDERLRLSDYAYPRREMVERFRLLLDARQVPGLGFAYFRVNPQPGFPRYRTGLRWGERFLENKFLRIEVEENGSLTLFDKRTQQTFHNLHLFEDGGDAGDEYNYSYPREDRILTTADVRATWFFQEKGPLRAILVISFSWRIPAGLTSSRRKRKKKSVVLPIHIRVILYHNQPRVEFETEVRNTARDHRLRVLFPTGFFTHVTYADSQFCITRREHPTVDEKKYTIEVPVSVHPMQRGVTILQGQRGITIAAAGLPEYELKLSEPGTLALTLLRCVGRLSGGDLLTRPGGEAGWISRAVEAQCPGTHRFRYAIITHTPEEFFAYDFVNDQLERFHLPCRAVQRITGVGLIPIPFWIQLSPAALVMTAFKPAENGHGYIFRCYNPGETSLQGEMRTGLKLISAWLTRLDEKNIKALKIENHHLVKFLAPPRTIVTLRLKFDGLTRGLGENLLARPGNREEDNH